MALISLEVCDLPGWVEACLGLAVVVSLAIGFVCHCISRSLWFVKEICLTPEAKWWLRIGDGAELSARLVANYVHPLVVILNFSLGHFRRRSVILLPDSADPEEIRRLRVWLTTAKSEEA